jgi:hypothetical protein
MADKVVFNTILVIGFLIVLLAHTSVSWWQVKSYALGVSARRSARTEKLGVTQGDRIAFATSPHIGSPHSPFANRARFLKRHTANAARDDPRRNA